ncbi:MAG: DNA methyltransferase [Gaiellaceae bacterium]
MTTTQSNTTELPLAVWPCAQTTSQWQRHQRYLADCKHHPGKMLPELARRAICAYSDPGDLVVDPMCGIGTTLVEAIHLDRNALGIELEPRWASLATANLAHAREQGATGKAGVVEGDARALPRLLTRNARKLLRTSGAKASPGNVARLGAGSVDLILTSPPYRCEIQMIDKPAWLAGGRLGANDTRNYSADRDNLGHARGAHYRDAMADVYAAAAAALKPGGFLVVVTKNLRAGGALHDLAGDTAELCQQTGLLYWQHVIALHAAIRDSQLVARPSFWQLSTTRKALTRGERIHLVCHEDVLVFRKPDTAAAPATRQKRTKTADARRAA